MDKLLLLELLVESTREMKDPLGEYEISEIKANQEYNQAVADGSTYSRWQYSTWDKKIPTKAPIRNNLKMIRRIALETSNEL